MISFKLNSDIIKMIDMMQRMIISVDKIDKMWLQEKARTEHVSVAELIRKAVRDYRKKKLSVQVASFSELLSSTRTLWHEGDGLAFQKKLRQEWDR